MLLIVDCHVVVCASTVSGVGGCSAAVLRVSSISWITSGCDSSVVGVDRCGIGFFSFVLLRVNCTSEWSSTFASGLPFTWYRMSMWSGSLVTKLHSVYC